MNAIEEQLAGPLVILQVAKTIEKNVTICSKKLDMTCDQSVRWAPQVVLCFSANVSC